uniref:Cationic amino acid transporter C-terminal domain-containing protein n=1 Tax=Ciona savignyi TaxID=51511 RepID=H2ZMS1_CIOSA
LLFKMCSNIGRTLSRLKTVDEETMGESKLARVLTVFDLTALGVGATLGAGVYILTGSVAKDTTGPSVVISFLIAALTSILSGLCYAEFGARVPKAGSGYVYSYVTVGECCAFVIGWNLILSYVIGRLLCFNVAFKAPFIVPRRNGPFCVKTNASVARAWTGNFDALIGNKIKTHMLSCCSMDVPGLAEYPDIFSFAIVMLLTALIAFGVKEFALVNKVFTVLNIGVILFVVIAGLTQADIHNWNWTTDEIHDYFGMVTQTTIDMTPYGTGGFMPFGFGGLISGTATCFYAFVGFDCIATTGEEAINPQKSIPLGIVLSLAVCCIAYLAISATLTLMRPYFLLDTLAPLPVAFEEVGMSWASYPVAVGAICALSTSLLGAMFPMPRIIYAMAIDGLLFEFLANVHKKTKTPLVATFLSGTLAGIMAVFFDLKELVDLMSIGTLAAYTLVATSVLLLRYQPDATPVSTDEATYEKGDSKPITQSTESFEIRMLIQPKSSLPTQTVSSIVNWCTVASALSMTLFSVTAVLASSSGWNGASIAFSVIFMICSILPMICIGMQPQSNKKLSFAAKSHLLFQVPLVPTVPALNMFVNIYLMVSLPPSTWYKMLIWLVMGKLFFYELLK